MSATYCSIVYCYVIIETTEICSNRLIVEKTIDHPHKRIACNCEEKKKESKENV